VLLQASIFTVDGYSAHRNRTADTGYGIPGELLPKIFDLFYTTKKLKRAILALTFRDIPDYRAVRRNHHRRQQARPLDDFHRLSARLSVDQPLSSLRSLGTWPRGYAEIPRVSRKSAWDAVDKASHAV
jgi:hypothetical protein